MRGHAVPSRCPRCGEPSLPAPDQRLIDCPSCRLSYDWVRRASDQDTSADDHRGEPPTQDPPAGLETRLAGTTLELTLPRLTGHGVAMLAVSLACGAAGVAMYLASDLKFAVALVALAIGFGAAGIIFTFTRRRLTATPTELRMGRVPFGGTSAVIPLRDLEQLAIARTRRRRRQSYDDIELWAQTTRGDVFLLTTRDVQLARYLEQRIEFHLRIADDRIEMVVAGAE